MAIPPAVVVQQFGIHLAYESRVASGLKHSVYSPTGQRRLAVAGIVFARIDIDAVYHHTVGLLIIEHHAYVILGQFGEKRCHGSRKTPAVPRPTAHEIAHSMTGHNAVVEQSAAQAAPVGNKRGDGFHGHAVVVGRHVWVQHLVEIAVPACEIVVFARTVVTQERVGITPLRLLPVARQQHGDYNVGLPETRGQRSRVVVARHAQFGRGRKGQHQCLTRQPTQHQMVALLPHCECPVGLQCRESELPSTGVRDME